MKQKQHQSTAVTQLTFQSFTVVTSANGPSKDTTLPSQLSTQVSSITLTHLDEVVVNKALPDDYVQRCDQASRERMMYGARRLSDLMVQIYGNKSFLQWVLFYNNKIYKDDAQEAIIAFSVWSLNLYK